MDKNRKTSHILNVFQYDADGHVVLPASLTLGIAPAGNDNSGKVGTTAWVRTYVSGLSYQGAITLTVTGTSGAATLVGNTLNIPTYTLAGLGGQAALSGTGFVKISGTTISYDNSTYATQTYVGTQIANLVDSSPATLDTLNELAAALGDDPNFATTVATSIGTKQAQLNGTGFVKVTGTTVSYDNSTYLTTGTAGTTYVPYTGGTANVNLGVYDLDGGNININGAGSGGGALRLKQFGSSEANREGYNSISTLTSGVFYFTSSASVPNFKNFALNPSGLTDNTLRTYALPDASGTLALTSNLSSYLPLTGGTVTGLATFYNADSYSDQARFGGGANNRYLYTYVDNSGVGLATATNFGGESIYFNPVSNYIDFSISSSSKMKLVTGGGLEIGYYSIQNTHKLDVNGAVRFANLLTGTDANFSSKVLIGAVTGTDSQAKLELISSSGPIGLKIKSSGANGNNTFLSIESSKEWRFVTNRGDLIGGNQGDLIIRNNTDGVNAIILNQNGNMGVGAPNPRTRLQVTPTSNGEVPVLGTATGVAIFTSTNTNYGLQFNSTSDGSFHIQSQRFDNIATAYNLVLNYAGGNVAIGTQSANGKLQITGAHTSGYGILNINSSDSCLISLDSSSTYDVRLRYKYQGTDQWFTGMYDDTSYKFVNAPGTSILTLAQSGAATLKGNITIDKGSPTLRLAGSAYGNSGARIQFEGWAPASGYSNWQIDTAFTGGNELCFVPSTTGGGSTFTTPVFRLSSTGAGTFSSIIDGTIIRLSSTQPLAFTGGGNTATYTQTAIYSSQTNTSGDPNNGIFIERGRLTDSASAEVRHLVIGARGGQIQWKCDGVGYTTQNSAAEVKPSADADLFVGRFSGGSAKLFVAYQSGSDGYLELRTGANTTVTKLSGYTGTPAYMNTKLTVGGTGSYTSSTLAVEGSLKVQRTIYSWYQGGSNAWDNYNYLHIKTNISSGLGGNIHYTMSLFTARLYSYTGTIREGQLGFHNWDGAFFAPATTGNIWAGPYRSSDGFIVLVLIISSSSHTGVTIDWHQAFPYPFVDKVATAVSPSNSTSGVY